MSEAISTDIVIGQRRIPYRLVRSDSARKLKLSMTMDEFRVTAPVKACDSEIQQALSQKHKWIIENYAALQEKYEQTHKIARFRTGAKLPYWGRLSQLRTQLADVDAPSVTYKNGFYLEHPNYSSSSQHDDAIEAALHAYLKQRFTTEAQSFALKYSELLSVECQSLRVTEMAKRWGSCTEAGTVSLDWRLVYAPKRVSAYVVAHELAHLKVSNHSSKFWNLLSSVYGEHQREHDWLQKNEHLLGYKRIFLSGTHAN
jgi:predicted metal-dependent hydrolase